LSEKVRERERFQTGITNSGRQRWENGDCSARFDFDWEDLKLIDSNLDLCFCGQTIKERDIIPPFNSKKYKRQRQDQGQENGARKSSSKKKMIRSLETKQSTRSFHLNSNFNPSKFFPKRKMD